MTRMAGQSMLGLRVRAMKAWWRAHRGDGTSRDASVCSFASVAVGRARAEHTGMLARARRWGERAWVRLLRIAYRPSQKYVVCALGMGLTAISCQASPDGSSGGSTGADPGSSAAADPLASAATPREDSSVRRGNSPGDSAQPSVSAAPPSDRARGRVVIGVRTIPSGLDPLRSLDPWARRIADDLLFEALTRRSSKAAPWATWELADRCVVDDPEQVRAVRCRLRSGAQFHDGTPVTARDVQYSYEYWLDPRREWHRLRHGLAELSRVDVVDGPFGERADAEQWIQITFNRAEPLALELLAEVKVVPERAHRTKGTAFASAPVGSGPLRVDAFTPDELTLVAAESYERQTSTVDVGRTVVFRRIDDGARGLTLLRRGVIDILDEVAPAHVPGELAKPGMTARFIAVLATPPRYDLLLLNAKNSALADLRVRQALDTGLPRYRLAAGPPASLVAETTVPVDLQAPQRIDLEALAAATDPRTADAGLPPPLVNKDPMRVMEAGPQLDDAGWLREHGQRRKGTTALRLTLMWEGGTGRAQRLATAVRAGLTALAIAVPYSTAAWSYLRLLLRRGEFEMFLLQLATHSDADLFPLFHRAGSLNLTGVADPQLDAALEAYRHAMTREARDQAKASVASLLARQHVTLVLHAPAHVLLLSRSLGDVEFVDDLPRLDTLRHTAGASSPWVR